MSTLDAALLLPWLFDLDLGLLHLLPQVGKLGRRFSGGLAFVLGHVGGPPIQFYRWRATTGRMAASGFTDLDPVNTDGPAEGEAGHEKTMQAGR